MARQPAAVALMFFAVVGVAFAAHHGHDKGDAPAQAPAAAVAQGPAGEAAEPADDGIIGTIDGDNDAAPIGAPVPAGVFLDLPTPPAPTPTLSNGAATLEVSAAAAGFAALTALAAFIFSSDCIGF